MARSPLLIVLRCADEDPAFDDAVLEGVEAYLLVLLHLALAFRLPRLLHDEVAHVLMQPFDVHRVERVLHHLRVVARKQCVADLPRVDLLQVQVIRREKRGRLRTEVRVEQAALVAHGYAFMRILSLNRASGSSVSSYGCSMYWPAGRRRQPPAPSPSRQN